jgi:hypothetical protein
MYVKRAAIFVSVNMVLLLYACESYFVCKVDRDDLHLDLDVTVTE